MREQQKKMIVGLIAVVCFLSTGPLLEANARSTDPSDLSPIIRLSEDAILNRLMAIKPLAMRTHGSPHSTIKSNVFCYCLHKGPKLAQNIRHQAATQFQKGVEAMQANHRKKAVEAFTRAVQLNPRDPLAYINRGLSYSHTGSFQLAKADFSQALSVDKQQGLAYYARGLIILLLGNAKEALGDFQRAVALGNTHASRLLNQMTGAQSLHH